MTEVGSFPFDRLLRIPAAALEPLRSIARAAGAPSGWNAALDALRTVLTTDIRLDVVDVRWADPRALPELPDELAALRVELPSGVSIVELDPSTAVALVDAALGTSAEADPSAFRPLRNAELGVLAYLAARLVLAARPRGGRVLGWTTDPRALAVALRAAPHVAIRLDLTVGQHQLGARLWVPTKAAALPAVPPDLEPFRELPVLVRAEVGAVSLSAADVALLSPGDVVLLDSAHARPEAGAWVGDVRVGVIGARMPWFAATPEPTGVRVRIRSVLIDKEMVPMADKETAAGPGSLGPLAAEVPVEVVVELGRATMTVGVLSALSPGEVVVLDRGPTDPVTLTAGNRVLGRGELVVVDGQVGVRIVDVARR